MGLAPPRGMLQGARRHFGSGLCCLVEESRGHRLGFAFWRLLCKLTQRSLGPSGSCKKKSSSK